MTSSSRIPSLRSTQITLVNSFKEELILLLTRKSKITKVLTERGDDEIYNDEVRKSLERKGFKINEWGKIEAEVNRKKTFIRAGSSKAKGWQVTFRGEKPGSLKTRLETGDGFLLMPRGPILLIPLNIIRDFVKKIDNMAFERDTIDIFLRFDEKQIFVVYKNSEIDVTSYSVLTYPK
jgi:hypothetical protein